MMKLIPLLIIIIIICLIGIYYKIIYNKIMANKIKVDEAHSIILDNLKKRYDYIIRTSHLVKTKIDLDIDLFKEIEKIKVKEGNPIILDEKIKTAYNLILQLKEDYPKLAENRGFKDILNDFAESNEMIEAAKSFYDKYGNLLNELISKFPINIVASIHKVSKVTLYKATNLDDKILTNIEK